MNVCGHQEIRLIKMPIQYSWTIVCVHFAFHHRLAQNCLCCAWVQLSVLFLIMIFSAYCMINFLRFMTGQPYGICIFMTQPVYGPCSDFIFFCILIRYLPLMAFDFVVALRKPSFPCLVRSMCASESHWIRTHHNVASSTHACPSTYNPFTWMSGLDFRQR